nr:immunoglobulin light chain junction region [Macaca mulatta]
CLQTLEFPWAF